MSKKIDQDGFPLMDIQEQREILDIVKNFIFNVLGKPEDSVYISSFPSDKGNAFMQIKLFDLGDGDDIYLRFGKYNFDVPSEKRIVVARIGFKDKFVGNGTKLLQMLCSLGEKYNFQTLSIECPNPDCQAFMKKLGFEKDYMQLNALKDSIHQYKTTKKASSV